MKIGLLMSLLLFAMVARSQTFTFGPLIGVNFSSLNFDKRITVSDTAFRFMTQDAKIGFVGGLFFRFKYHKFYFQPEALYSQERSSFIINSNYDSTGELKELQFNKFDFPLILGMKFGRSFRLQGGIVGSYIFSSTVGNIKNTYDYFSKISTSDLQWGFQLGFGFDLKKRATFDFKYEGNLGVNSNNMYFMGNNYPLNNRKNNIQFTLGIALIPFKKK